MTAFQDSPAVYLKLVDVSNGSTADGYCPLNGRCFVLSFLLMDSKNVPYTAK